MAQGLFQWFSQSVLLWSSGLALQLNLSAFLFGFLLFLTLVLHTFQGAASAPRALKYAPCTHQFSRQESCPSVVCYDANSVLGNLGASSQCAMGVFGDVLFEQGPIP